MTAASRPASARQRATTTVQQYNSGSVPPTDAPTATAASSESASAQPADPFASDTKALVATKPPLSARGWKIEKKLLKTSKVQI